MFKAGKPNLESPPSKLADRLKTIASKSAPMMYTDVGGHVKRASRQAVFRQATVTLLGGEVVPVVVRSQRNGVPDRVYPPRAS